MKRHGSPSCIFSFSLYLRVANVCLSLSLRFRGELNIGETGALVQARSALYLGMRIRADPTPAPTIGNYHGRKNETP
jgi:hypothetical protein